MRWRDRGQSEDEAMGERPAGYVPAAGHDWLLPLYDPIVELLFPARWARQRILAEARIGPGDRVLDVGCGTGTLAVLLTQQRPEARVTGLDGDPKALAIARRKAERAGCAIGFDEALAYALPYPEGAFERAVCSLVFHHLSAEHRRAAAGEIRRVLAPGGRLLLVDFGPPSNAWERCLARVQGGQLRDNLTGKLPEILREAGFAGVEELGRRGTLAGSLWFYRATKAGGGAPLRA